MARASRVILVVIMLGAVVAVILLAPSHGRSLGLIAPFLIGALATIFVKHTKKADPAAVKVAQKTATSLGLAYVGQLGTDFTKPFRGVPVVKPKSTARHVMTGDIDGWGLTIFESMLRVNTGQSVAFVHHTIVSAAAPPWPRTDVVPRRGMGSLLWSAGVRTTFSLEDPQFNGRFKVRSQDEDFAVTLLSPEIQKLLTSNRTLSWHLADGRISIAGKGELKPRDVDDRVRLLLRFLGLVHEELWLWTPPDPHVAAIPW